MTIKRLCYMGIAAAAVLCGGCIASHTRTGEVGLLTKRQFQIASAAYHANDSGMNMFAAFAPFEITGASIIGVTYAPCVDVLCLPYDFFLKLTGDNICIVDDDGIPVEGVDVELYGHSDAIMISNGLGALHDEVTGRSNKDGLFRTWRRLQNIPLLSFCMTKTGYYQARGRMEHLLDADGKIWHVAIKKRNAPIPLFVKNIGAYGYEESTEDLFSKGNGVLQFDFMKGEWLPPVGNGEVADVEFRRLPHEDFGEAAHDVVKGRSYRDSMSVRFLGDDNGLVEMKVRPGDELKIRTAPEEGFAQERVCWTGVEKDLQRVRSYDKDRCFCFRIRTRRNDKGEIIEAYYGKIYGDIRMLAKCTPFVPVAAVRFTYYLNSKNLDRNLEWNRQNLCVDPIYPRSKDRWSYKSFNSEHAP